jgi:matrix metalloproteinase-14 (membrane-inserted)
VLENAIKDFQHFAGLELTGKLDAYTLELMQLPRCGVRDTIAAGTESGRRRKRRYALEGSRWKESRLTWAVNKYPNKKLTKQQIDETLTRAFEIWGAVSNLEFVRVESDNPKINILFVERDHGDEDPFDGPGGVLAHAYFPRYGGDMHVDNEESWTLNTPQVKCIPLEKRNNRNNEKSLTFSLWNVTMLEGRVSNRLPIPCDWALKVLSSKN